MFSLSITPGLAMKMAGVCLWEVVKTPWHILRCLAGVICLTALAAYMKITN